MWRGLPHWLDDGRITPRFNKPTNSLFIAVSRWPAKSWEDWLPGDVSAVWEYGPFHHLDYCSRKAESCVDCNHTWGSWLEAEILFVGCNICIAYGFITNFRQNKRFNDTVSRGFRKIDLKNLNTRLQYSDVLFEEKQHRWQRKTKLLLTASDAEFSTKEDPITL